MESGRAFHRAGISAERNPDADRDADDHPQPDARADPFAGTHFDAQTVADPAANRHALALPNADSLRERNVYPRSSPVNFRNIF